MLVLGPVSSLFDFLTFFALLSLFGASEPLFQTGWFVESLGDPVPRHLRDPDAQAPVAQPPTSGSDRT